MIEIEPGQLRVLVAAVIAAGIRSADPRDGAAASANVCRAEGWSWDSERVARWALQDTDALIAQHERTKTTPPA